MSPLFLFADDTKIFRGVLRDEDSCILQGNLNLLQKWSDKWLLKFHPNILKCKVMTVTTSERPVPYYTQTQNSKTTNLQQTEAEKDVRSYHRSQPILQTVYNGQGKQGKPYPGGN